MGNSEIPITQKSTQLLKKACESSRICKQPTNQIVITGSPDVIIANFGPESQILKCPYCYHFVPTKVRPSATTKTHLWALVLCMCCCWLCSCCPYIIDSCQDKNHYCRHCGAYLGSYRT